jgi:hypothetical protein
MPRKLTIEAVRQLAATKGGLLLSTEYHGSQEKLRWKCGEGHEWEATQTSVRSGRWCRTCAYAKRSAEQANPNGLIKARGLAVARGGLCLSNVYTNNRTALRWRCSEGHEWEAAPYSVQAGRWCRSCSYIKSSERRANPKGLEKSKEVAISHGGVCLTESYVNAHTYMRWRCSDGHEWEATYNAIVNIGWWCPVCKGLRHAIASRNPNGFAIATEVAEERGGILVSNEYRGGRHPLEWRVSSITSMCHISTEMVFRIYMINSFGMREKWSCALRIG